MNTWFPEDDQGDWTAEERAAYDPGPPRRILTHERDHWIRLFNRLDSAINHHQKATSFKDDCDEALYAARDRILRDAGNMNRPKSGVHQEA